MNMLMDRQTEVGHINLIGRLVTRNPPNKQNNQALTMLIFNTTKRDQL